MKKIIQTVQLDTSSVEALPATAAQAILANTNAQIDLADTYQQVHDFTAAGAARFAEFLAEAGAVGLSAEACRAACLGVIEDNLNGTIGGPLAWELNAANSRDGKAHTFTADHDDLIIETVTPDEQA